MSRHDDLTPGMVDTLDALFEREQTTGKRWNEDRGDGIHRSSLYALERRGLVVRNGYYGVVKLTDAGREMFEVVA